MQGEGVLMTGWRGEKNKKGRLVFSAKTERTFFFVLTLMMALYGIAIRLTGG